MLDWITKTALNLQNATLPSAGIPEPFTFYLFDTQSVILNNKTGAESTMKHQILPLQNSWTRRKHDWTKIVQNESSKDNPPLTFYSGLLD